MQITGNALKEILDRDFSGCPRFSLNPAASGAVAPPVGPGFQVPSGPNIT